MSRLVAVGVCLLGLIAAGCSIPSEQNAVVIDRDELPDGLQSPNNAPSTSTPTGDDEAVTLFFIDSENVVVSPVERRVDEATVSAALEQLFESPSTDEERNANLTNLLFVDSDDEEQGPLELLDVETQDSRLVIRLQGTIQGEGDDRRRVFAQIVYTATQRGYPNSRTRVVLRDGEGELIEVTTDETTKTGAVGRTDFASLNPAARPPATVPTTTARPAPSVPTAGSTG